MNILRLGLTVASLPVTVPGYWPGDMELVRVNHSDKHSVDNIYAMQSGHGDAGGLWLLTPTIPVGGDESADNIARHAIAWHAE